MIKNSHITPKQLAQRQFTCVRGQEHHSWKGDEVGYRALHSWVQRKLGSPQFCEECKRTKPPKGKGKNRSYFQWANLSGKYLRNTRDWKRLCYKCHKEFDKHKH